MRLPTTLTVLLATLLLASCAAMERSFPGPPTPCSRGICDIRVRVVSCQQNDLEVTPKHVGISEAQNIRWTMESDDYVFADDGIVVNGSGFTRNPGSIDRGSRFMIHDDHTDRTPAIKYSVHVKRANGTECTRYDPFISNQ
jgi:hypothetical protein